MPDLQTELFKKVLPKMNSMTKQQPDSLDNLSFDDGPGDAPEQSTNLSRSIWEYVQTHPGCTSTQIRDQMGLSGDSVSTRLTQMFKRGWFSRTQDASGALRYTVKGKTYPAKEMTPQLREALAKAHERHTGRREARNAARAPLLLARHRQK